MENREGCRQKSNEVSVGHSARLEWKSDGQLKLMQAVEAARFTPWNGSIAVRPFLCTRPSVRYVRSISGFPGRTSPKWAFLLR